MNGRQPAFIQSSSGRLSGRYRAAIAVPDTATQAFTRAKEIPMHRHPKRPLDAVAQLAPFATCTRHELTVADSLMTTVAAGIRRLAGDRQVELDRPPVPARSPAPRLIPQRV